MRNSPKTIIITMLVLLALVISACGSTPMALEPADTQTVTPQPTAQPTPGEKQDTPVDPTPQATAVPTEGPTPEPTPVPSTSVSGTGIEEARQAVVRISQIGDYVSPDGETVGSYTGSGFIISSSGLVVTNNHVAGGAAILEVTVDGETEPRNARVVGLSECADLAVIQLEGDDFPYVEFQQGPSPVGTRVLAAGYPLSTTEFTLTSGIISTAELPGETNWASVEAVIEHDARIRPGNSGGPLFTDDGFVVGVNYAGDTEYDYNLAIAAQYAQPIIDKLSAGESWEAIGLNVTAHRFGEVTGLWVNAIETGSPADLAGIKPGDLVTEMEGVPLATDGTLYHYCEILRSQGTTGQLAVEVIRLSTGEILEGNVNGSGLEVVFSAEVEAPGNAGEGTPTAPVSAEFMRLMDDTGLISIQIPTSFTESITEPLDVDGLIIPSILSAPSLESAFGSDNVGYTGNGVALFAYTTPGLDMVDTTFEVMKGDLDSCDLAGDAEPYSANGFEGYVLVLENCGGMETSIVFVGAQIPGEDRFMLMGIQIVDQAMIEALPSIFTSFRWEK